MSDIPDPYPDDRKPSCETHGLHSPCVHDFPPNTPDTATVPVPRALVLALADEWEDCAYAYRQSDPLHHVYKGCANRLRALGAAVERPTAGEDVDDREHLSTPTGDIHEGPPEDCLRCAPADPVSEARCACGHGHSFHDIGHEGDGQFCMARPGCPCTAFTPAPPPTTPREELADVVREFLYGRMDGEMGDFMREESARLVDYVIAPMLADAWDEGKDAAHIGPHCIHNAINPYRDPPAGAATPPTTALTDEERAELGRLVGNGYLTRVGTRALLDKVESIIAARFDAGERGEP